MLQRELLIILSLVVALFLGVAGAGWFAVQRLNDTSKKLAVDTLPGLVEAGLAEEQIHEDRHRMREMIFPHTAAERQAMISLVDTNSADSQWRAYAASIFEVEDRQNYEAMLLARSNYLQTCPAFYDLVRLGKIDDATAYFYGNQNRLFQAYLAAAKKVFGYNVEQGETRAQSILNTIRYAPWAIGVLCALVFVFGLVVGLRTALGNMK